MSYEVAQSVLTAFIQVVAVGSVCIFAVAAHCHAMAEMRAKATAPATTPEAESKLPAQSLPANTASDTPDIATTELQPEQGVVAAPLIKLHVVPDASVAASDTFDEETERERLQYLNTTQLRKECSRCQIKWRNVHGNGKHLRKPEMIAALLEHLTLRFPTSQALAMA